MAFPFQSAGLFGRPARPRPKSSSRRAGAQRLFARMGAPPLPQGAGGGADRLRSARAEAAAQRGRAVGRSGARRGPAPARPQPHRATRHRDRAGQQPERRRPAGPDRRPEPGRRGARVRRPERDLRHLDRRRRGEHDARDRRGLVRRRRGAAHRVRRGRREKRSRLRQPGRDELDAERGERRRGRGRRDRPDVQGRRDPDRRRRRRQYPHRREGRDAVGRVRRRRGRQERARLRQRAAHDRRDVVRAAARVGRGDARRAVPGLRGRRVRRSGRPKFLHGLQRRQLSKRQHSEFNASGQGPVDRPDAGHVGQSGLYRRGDRNLCRRHDRHGSVHGDAQRKRHAHGGRANVRRRRRRRCGRFGADDRRVRGVDRVRGRRHLLRRRRQRGSDRGQRAHRIGEQPRSAERRPYPRNGFHHRRPDSHDIGRRDHIHSDIDLGQIR